MSSALRLLAALGLAALTSCARGEAPVLTIFAAASLGSFLSAVEPRFESAHSGVDVRVELSGSRLACAKVADQGREADVVLSADHELIDELLVPAHAAYNLRFARNALVIAYAPRSRGAAALAGGEPWQRVLARPEVVVGVANPGLAPVGARAFAALRRNDELVEPSLRTGASITEKLGREHQRPDVAKLLAPLQAGELDAAFVYLSEARQHGLPYVRLDARIDGSSGPEAALYGLTIPRRAPQPALALAYVRLLLSEEGRRLAAAQHVELLPPEERWATGQAPADLVGAPGPGRSAD